MMWEYSGTITCNHWLRKKYWLQKISEQHKSFGLYAATTLCCNEISQHLLIGKSSHKGLSNVFTTRYWRNTCSCHTLITDNKMKGVIYHCTCILNHTWASPPTPPPHPIGKFGNHDKYLSDNFPIGKFDIVLHGNCPMGWGGGSCLGQTWPSWNCPGELPGNHVEQLKTDWGKHFMYKYHCTHKHWAVWIYDVSLQNCIALPFKYYNKRCFEWITLSSWKQMSSPNLSGFKMFWECLHYFHLFNG